MKSALIGATLSVLWSILLVWFAATNWPPPEVVVIPQYRYLCQPPDGTT